MISISKPIIGEEEKAAVLGVLESGMLAQGERTAEFEERFADICGVKYAIAVSSGTTALHLALLANDIGEGDEVITTPFTFMATASAIIFTGAKPVFVDIDEETFNIDPALIEASITPRTKAILPVHLYGQMSDMDQIQKIADQFGLRLIEDACQAVLATYNGRFAGSIGTGTFSFYATKNMMTGEGGMITTNDEAIAENCKMLRSHGMKHQYHHEVLGFNFRLTDIQAAIGLVQLDRLAELTAKRKVNAAFFNSKIESVITPKVRDGYGHVWHQYTVRVDERKRDEAMERLNEAGIGSRVYYPIPLHKQNSLREFVDEISLPVTERIANQVLSLPVHPQLTDDELERIVTEVNKL